MATVKKKYQYSGEKTWATIQMPGEPDQDVVFRDGGEYSLPAENNYVADLVEQKLLTEVVTPIVVSTKVKGQDNG